MRTLLSVLLLACCMSVPIRAADADAAKQLVKTAVDQITALMLDEALGPEARRDSILKVVGESFDFPLMAKLALGRTHWSSMDTLQQEEFTRLFVRQLEDSYYDKVNLLLDQHITIGEVVERGGRFQVSTQVVPKAGDPLAVDYRVHAKDGPAKVYDVAIEGVSLLKSFRSQYHQVLQAEGVDGLLAKMNSRVLAAPIGE